MVSTLVVWIGAAATITGAILGAVAATLLQAVLPTDFLGRIGGRPRPDLRIEGTWNSWWGASEDEVKSYHETVTIARQRRDRIWGTATRDEEPGKVWELEGRFDGHHLQMIYYPSPASEKPGFLDYGCYFLVRQGTGNMSGLSIGRGPDRQGKDTTEVEYCYMEKI